MIITTENNWTKHGDRWTRKDGVSVRKGRGPMFDGVWICDVGPESLQQELWLTAAAAKAEIDCEFPLYSGRVEVEPVMRGADPHRYKDDDAPTRASVLDTAKGYVTNDRQSSYGDCEDNFANIATLWGTYLRTEVKPADVAAMMVLLKAARLMSSPEHTDNWIDIAGYAACGGEITGRKGEK